MSPYQKELRERVGDMLIVTPGVAALVRDHEGRVLLQKRSDDGNWSVPAGGISPGEEPAKAVVREVWEETGLKVRPERLVAVLGGRECRYTYPDGNTDEGVSLVFECRILGGKLHARDGESETLRFFPPAEMPELAMTFPKELFERPNGASEVFLQWNESWLDELR
jgi:8-oxo-dGTP pyrophosphatase MutT (NUDIX family)